VGLIFKESNEILIPPSLGLIVDFMKALVIRD